MKLLNLGCGSRYHSDWTNIDFTSNNEYVIAHNLLEGIPFSNNKFNVLYHSHVLEHFNKDDAKNFLKECYRVMAVDGVIRIVIPDLEQIVESYINALNTVLQDTSEINKANYDWTVIELIDQLVRPSSGGEMGKLWNSDEITNEKFIAERVGYEFKNYRENHLKNLKEKKHKVQPRKKTILSRIKKKIRKLIFPVKKTQPISKYEQLGRFRLSGEIHQWMYDRHSIVELLEQIGFKNVKITSAFESSIPNWEKYKDLDVIGNEKRKPDSLYVEAIK